MSGILKLSFMIKEPMSITRLIVGYDKVSHVTGFKFINMYDEVLLKIGKFSPSKKEIRLQDEDRIVGIESRIQDFAFHHSLVLVIARVE